MHAYNFINEAKLYEYVCQLSALQMQMNRMKEENKVLRRVVEQTMKDYYDLQMKFAVIQQNTHNVIN